MKPRLDTAIVQGLAFLADAQVDGGFAGEVSLTQDFKEASSHPTIFLTALIGMMLGAVEGGQAVCSEAATYLYRHRGSSWSWNYWEQDSLAYAQRRLPDDIDDTVCALAVIQRQSPGRLDGRALAQFAHVMISAEVQPGGPYHTWIERPGTAWQDVDVAVNANVGFLYRQLSIAAPSLEAYIEKQLSQALQSPYYAGEITILYLIARWYQSEQLRERLRSCDSHSCTPLELALLVSAYIAQGMGKGAEPLVERLVATQRHGSWPAAPMCTEQPDGVRLYIGSAALSTAAALEALAAYRQYLQQPGSRHDLTPIVKPAPRGLVALDAALAATLERDSGGHITGVPANALAALGKNVGRPTLIDLRLGSLYGWTAYTLYDDVMDEGDVLLLGAANAALRRTVGAFERASSDVAFAAFVQEHLDRIDAANTWEVEHARAEVRDGMVIIDRLPHYGSYAQLGQRSIGHLLSAAGAWHAAGVPLNSLAMKSLERFFEHFLIARQVNDDAHDWQEDLERGQLSAVVVMLLHDAGTPSVIELETIRPLQDLFWRETIERVSALITYHCDQAQAELAANPAIKDAQPLEAWLAPLRRAAVAAIVERDRAIAFSKSF